MAFLRQKHVTPWSFLRFTLQKHDFSSCKQVDFPARKRNLQGREKNLHGRKKNLHGREIEFSPRHPNFRQQRHSRRQTDLFQNREAEVTKTATPFLLAVRRECPTELGVWLCRACMVYGIFVVSGVNGLLRVTRRARGRAVLRGTWRGFLLRLRGSPGWWCWCSSVRHADGRSVHWRGCRRRQRW